jgi:serine/threonine protein kinase
VDPNGDGYSNEVDLWSLGVIVHNLIIPRCTHLVSPQELKERFERGDFSHFSRANVSPMAKDFIKKLLCVNPWRRMTAAQAMQHPWLSRFADDLDDLYERATENWKGRVDTVKIDTIANPGLGAPSVRVPSIIYEEPVPHDAEYNTEDEETEEANFESSGTKAAYDNIARDGKLRTAAQLAQEAKDKRAIITKPITQTAVTSGLKRKRVSDRDMEKTTARKLKDLRLESGEKSHYFSNLDLEEDDY